ncbi:hypothetical protein SPBR_00274 [Sporothrix brasiliensis 5110]|uniref:Uncharacterized protein n=1 Tax=Sporothrix brasiliensis 5110 TaxID=1398154 RepID=A0A0C2EWI1_9PEZI|nr:uncharacterized protein SPBR_00274 [Sporothrix brasiliensis 5110]KIH90939.1 hypothetical protein SPBR_00274 [Sporothrix brasiliensis 5110]
MSITDEDLQFMADGLWQDALLPDITDIYGIDMGTAGEAIETPGDRLLNPPETGRGNDRAKSSSSKKVSPATKPVKTSKSKVKQSKDEGAPPMPDLYLSSPVEVRPKKGGKMSKSMKGASQNESQRGRPHGPAKPHKPNAMFPELETDNGDPYELPISPKSNYRPQDTVGIEKRTSNKSTSPVAVPKPSSPVGGLIPSAKQPVKNQKRVAKRSFLDPPSTPLQSDTKVATTQMPLPNPTTKDTNPVVPATKSVRKPKATKRPAPAKKAAKPRETKKKTVARPPPVKEKKVGHAEDKYHIQDGTVSAENKNTENENITKKLRPRSERAPIMISSDSASSYEKDGYESDVAFVPDTGMTSITTPVAQMDPPDSVAKLLSKPVTDRSVAASSGRPKHDEVSADANHKNASTRKSVKVKKEMMNDGEESVIRGRQLSRSVQSLEMQNSHQKRQRSPSAAPDHRAAPKKQRAEPVRTESRVRNVLQQMAVPKDPFVEEMDENEPNRTRFTAKLLQSAAPPVQPAQPSTQTAPRYDKQHHVAQHKSHHVAPMPQVPPSSQPDGPCQAKSKPVDSDGIAREMMKLLAAGANDSPGRAQTARDIWLEEMDPYKETGQIMGYVCKTILRFLKSKEAAIEDVAEEYQQRGAAVLARMGALHGRERCALIHTFEQSRQRSLAVFEAAQRDVHILAARLERLNLAPVIQDVLADNAGSRLRLLQAEMV